MSRSKFMSSSNPFVSEKKFSENNLGTVSNDGVMTVQGAVNKTIILAAILFAVALASFVLFNPNSAYVQTLMYGGIFGGLALGMLTYFKPAIAHITAPLFAVAEGVVVGTISAIYSAMLGPDIIFNALMLTILCLVSMLVCYKMGWIQATQKFRSIITAATGAIMLIYLLSFVLGFFGIEIPYLHQANPIGIGLSFFIVGLATLNLILDFDNIERGARSGAAKQMEWVVSMGLLWTLVWLYLEILRLLAMIAMASSD